MKHLLLLTLAMGTLSVNSFAKIWRVNNNPGIQASFTTIQAAHNGAANGDTLYIESSQTSYGALACSKRLVIIGTGYFLPGRELQAFDYASLVGTINFNSGSNGSVVEGVSFNGSGVYIYDHNITVRRNNFASSSGSNTADYATGTVSINWGVINTVVTQNFGLTISCNNDASTGILIANNYIAVGAGSGNTTTGNCLNLNTSATAIIKNNIFGRGTVSVHNSNIMNNIMINGFFNGNSNLIANNLASGAQFGTANGNQASVIMANVFETTATLDSYYKLKSGSPAIGAGYGSTAQNPVDAGMFGGSRPYVLSGIPAIPAIYMVTNQPVGSNSDPVDVEVRVRSNN
ncbi:MAG: hypothetical protein J7621_14165 [Niastella sp.]|nr:hypothetical protein [Niastella sp.]